MLETKDAGKRKSQKSRWKILALVFLSLAISLTMDFVNESTGSQDIAFLEPNLNRFFLLIHLLHICLIL